MTIIQMLESGATIENGKWILFDNISEYVVMLKKDYEHLQKDKVKNFKDIDNIFSNAEYFTSVNKAIEFLMA